MAGLLAGLWAANCRSSRPRPEQGRKVVLCDHRGAGSKGHETRPTLMAHTHVLLVKRVGEELHEMRIVDRYKTPFVYLLSRGPRSSVQSCPLSLIAVQCIDVETDRVAKL